MTTRAALALAVLATTLAASAPAGAHGRHHHGSPGEALHLAIAPVAAQPGDGMSPQVRISAHVKDAYPIFDDVDLIALSPGAACPHTDAAAVHQLRTGQAMSIIESESVAQLIDTPSRAAVAATIFRYWGADQAQTVCGVLFRVTSPGHSRTLATARATS